MKVCIGYGGYLSTCELLIVAWKQIGDREDIARQWIVGFVAFDN